MEFGGCIEPTWVLYFVLTTMMCHNLWIPCQQRDNIMKTNPKAVFKKHLGNIKNALPNFSINSMILTPLI